MSAGMIFTKCPRIYGEANLLSGLPSIETHHDVILEQWTLYDRSRRMIPDSGFYRGIPTHAAVHGDAVTPYAAARIRSRLPDRQYFWLGPLHLHFGHFLVSTLARAWAFRDHVGPETVIVYVGPSTPQEVFRIAFVRECFTALGIQPDQMLQVNGPVYFPQITIPAMSFVENHSIFTSHIDMLRSIAGYWNESEGRQVEAPVYISKQNVSAGVRSVVNEAELSAELRIRGIEVACPESLPFKEQLNFWRSHRALIGFASSAFHMAAFFGSKRLCTISHDEYASTNQVLLDIASDNENLQVWAAGGLVARGASATFSHTVEIKDPRRFADRIVKLSQQYYEAQTVQGQRMAPEPRTLSHTVFVNEPFGLNLALGGLAMQSSTYEIDEGQNRTAEGALSGRLTGTYQCSTQYQGQPWWQVKLPGLSTIFEVRVFNRCDNPVAQARLTKLSILLSFDGTTWTTVATRAEADPIGGFHGEPYRWLAPPGVSARFVRLQLPNKNYLHVDQVEVFGELFQF